MTQFDPDSVCRTELRKIIEKQGLKDSFVTCEALMVKPVRAGAILDTLRKEQSVYERAAETLTFQGYVLQTLTGELTHQTSKTALRLTEKEVRILTTLIEAKGEPVARQKLLGSVWGYSEKIETHTLETHIYRLRQKIEKDPALPAILMTSEDGYKIIL